MLRPTPLTRSPGGWRKPGSSIRAASTCSRRRASAWRWRPEPRSAPARSDHISWPKLPRPSPLKPNAAPTPSTPRTPRATCWSAASARSTPNRLLPVVVGAEHGIERHRDDPGLDGAPEGVEELRAVLHHHEQPIPALHAQPQPGVAAAVDALGQLRVGDVPGRAPDDHLLAAPLGQVPVDEGRGHVEP